MITVQELIDELLKVEDKSKEIECEDPCEFTYDIHIIEEGKNTVKTDGRMYDDQDTGYDLMMLPEKKEGWMNIYSNGDNHRVSSPIYNSKEEALNNKASNAIDTVKIEWEE